METDQPTPAVRAAEAIQKHEGIDDDADADERRSAWAAITAAQRAEAFLRTLSLWRDYTENQPGREG